MSRAAEIAPPRRRFALAFLVGAALALLVPPMLTVGADPLGAAVGVLALALVALVALGLHRVGVGVLLGATFRSDDASALILSGRVTDPTHHPVRPRAPGPA